MAEMNTRNIVLNILIQVLYENRFSHVVLQEELRRYPELSQRDKAFIEHLTRSVLEHRIALTEVIDHYSKTKVRKMKPAIACILLMGSCQILLLETESYAAVNEAVRLTKKRGFSGLQGFVNGVLRTVSREGKAYYAALPEMTQLGIPEELSALLNAWYGEERALQFVRTLTEKQKKGVSVRRNRSRISASDLLQMLEAEGISAEETGYTDDTLYLRGLTSLETLQSFQNGYFYVQDLSSALQGDAVKDLFTRERTLRILDTCGAPGGKSIHLSDLSGGNARITVCDVSEYKKELIRENIGRSGFSNLFACVQDASENRPEWHEAFDLVVADVPCSGIGIIGNKPEIREHITEESLRSIEKLQKAILENVCDYVIPGGTLLYSTCTVNPDENENMLRDFLKHHPEFEAVDFSENMPDRLKTAAYSEPGMLLLLPGRDYEGTGFFIGRLKKEVTAGEENQEDAV